MSVTKLKRVPRLIEAPEGQPLRIRFGIGREDGFLKIGPEWDSPDHPLDTRALPWPIAEEAVDAILAAFYLHRLPLEERHAFMDECWRVLKPGAQLMVVVPFYTSIRALTDPVGFWPPVTDASFEWYSKAWRERENMQHLLPLNCDFAHAAGYVPQGDYLNGRCEEFTTSALAHEWNTMADLHVTLTKPAAQSG